MLAATTGPETWRQGFELLLALGLSAAIGLEREFREKSAGLRTQTLVGTGAALFMLISKFGFGDVVHPGRVVLDPSRVAAQIVSGIGFVGAGLIFVKRDSVRGLTTAATVWLTAAVGAAAGAGLPLLAVAGTLAHFLVVAAFTPVSHRLSLRSGARVAFTYQPGSGALEAAIAGCAALGGRMESVTVVRGDAPAQVVMRVTGRASPADLVALIAGLDGVESVDVAAADETDPVSP
ncbi:MAG TPA: MgtC/SapB family protein [Acidimicrobiales bacterium]|nr:MgtC/SapB family protein [Acidimicrobiales bacterium]